MIAANLRDALQSENQTRVAEQADVARSTLNDLVAGRTWPELITVAKLEEVLGTRLWPASRPPGAAPGT